MPGANRCQVLTHPNAVERVIVVILAHQSFQIVGNLPTALERGHQATLQGHLCHVAVDGLERCRLRGDEILQRGGRQRSGMRDILAVGVPQRLEPQGSLFALARRHVAARELIRVALEGTGTKYVRVDLELVDRVFEVHAVIAETVHGHFAHGIEVYLAGLCRQIVLRLTEGVADRDHAFAGDAKVAQRRADFLQLREARCAQFVEVQNNQLDARVRLCGRDRVRHVPEKGPRVGAARGLAERAPHRIAGELLDQLALRRNDERRGARHDRNGGMQRREHEAENNQHQRQVQHLADAFQDSPDQPGESPKRGAGAHSTLRSSRRCGLLCPTVRAGSTASPGVHCRGASR